jgi:Tol biopolymer transport system component
MAPSSRRRARPLNLESLEPRLALAAVAGIVDTTPPAAWSATDTLGADVSPPVQVGHAMRNASDVSGSGTPALTSSLAPQPARNGEIYAAVSESGSSQIWAFTQDDRNSRPVTSRERDGLVRASHPSVSADGTRLAFSGYTGDRADIYVINTDGTNLRKLTSSVANKLQIIPGISPDGRLIVYESNRGETDSDNSHLRIVPVDGGDDRQLTVTDGTYEDAGPKFSPRGDVILFASDRNNRRGHHDLYTINVDGTNLTRLTRGANNAYSRSWSPDGRRIVFNSQVRLNGSDPGYGELRIIDADGRHLRKLTSFRRNLRFSPVNPVPGRPPALRGDVTPAWSPNGKFIVFCGQSKSTGQYELFKVHRFTGRWTQLTRSAPGTNHVSVAWSVLPTA